MKRTSLVVVALLVWITVTTVPMSLAPAWAGESSERLASKVDRLFRKYDRRDSPGCAVGVYRDGELVLARGYGMADLEHDVPIGKDTVFYIGSTSKQFATACIVLLAEEGKLGLDDDVRKYIPELPMYDAPITIRQLVHHTSGIRDYLELWRLIGRDYLDHIPEAAVLELICAQKSLNFAPGERHLYSNSCYFLLSVIVERACGKTLRQYAEEAIFAPLGMTKTHFHDDPGFIIKDRAFGYAPADDGLGFRSMLMRFALVGSGGLYTTIEDLGPWVANFQEKPTRQRWAGVRGNDAYPRSTEQRRGNPLRLRVDAWRARGHVHGAPRWSSGRLPRAVAAFPRAAARRGGAQ